MKSAFRPALAALALLPMLAGAPAVSAQSPSNAAVSGAPQAGSGYADLADLVGRYPMILMGFRCVWPEAGLAKTRSKPVRKASTALPIICSLSSSTADS